MDMFKLAEQMAKVNVSNIKSLDINSIKRSVIIEPKISIPKASLVMPNPLSNSVPKVNLLSSVSETSNILTSSQIPSSSSNKIPKWVLWAGGITLCSLAVYTGNKIYNYYKTRRELKKM